MNGQWPWWRDMFPAGVFFLLMLLLAGCSGRQPTWIPSGARTEEQARLDQELCKYAGGNAVAPEPGRHPDRLPSIGVGQPPVADQMAAFDGCMESKGYRRR